MIYNLLKQIIKAVVKGREKETNWLINCCRLDEIGAKKFNEDNISFHLTECETADEKKGFIAI